MSGAPMDQRAIAREARSLIRGTAAKFAGRERGRDRAVRRDSYDVDDSRAQVFAPIGDGTKAGALGWADDLLRTAEEYDVVHRKKGQRGPLQANALRVLRILLTRFADFRTGRIDPALETIGKAAGLSKNAVIRALKVLQRHGFLDWIRRSRRTENARDFGPQREQATNAYFFRLSNLPKRVLQRFRDLQARRRLRTIGSPPPRPAPSEAPAVADSSLSAALSRLGVLVDNASSQ